MRFELASQLPFLPFFLLLSAAGISNHACAVTAQATVDFSVNLASGGQAISSAAAVDETPACEKCFTKRWIYYYGGMGYQRGMENASYKKLVELIGRAKHAGYNGIVLNVGGDDSYTTMLKPNEASPFQANFDEIKKLASDNGIELIPFGGSPDVAAKIDPTLAEALPVSNALFEVNGNNATPKREPLKINGGFDTDTKGWELWDSSVHYDTTEQNGAIRLDQTDPNGRARLYRSFSGLNPHTAYRMSFSVKTQNYDAPLRIQIYPPADDDKKYEIPLYLSRNYLGWGTTDGKWNARANTVAATQDWTRYNIDFNTRDYSGFRLLIGAWGNGTTKTGFTLIDNIEISEIGLAHTVRRPSLPVVVSAEADGGRTVYTEGKDYKVGVESLIIPPGSAIHDKDRLLVSSYEEATNMLPIWNSPGNSCSSKYYDVQKAAYQNIKQLFSSSKFFINYDEWRIMNWDPSCGNLTAGEYLENTTRTMQNMLLRENQNIDMYIWNDMFDPSANAIDHYLAVNGPLKDGWKGLDSSTTIMNWIQNPTNDTNLQVPSLKFFNGHKFRQMIALYYDDRSLGRTKQWLDSLDVAEKDGVTGVDGFMYTTWQNNSNYDDLEKVAQLIKDRYPTRWPK